MKQPIVMVGSYPPRLSHVATFCRDAREHIEKVHPDHDMLVVSHTDGSGRGVLPMIDTTSKEWWKSAAAAINRLDPHVVHLQYTDTLYAAPGGRAKTGDADVGFLSLLKAIEAPTLVEIHRMGGPLRRHEPALFRSLGESAGIVVVKCSMQRWRLEWQFAMEGWRPPRNVMVIPYGAREDAGVDIEGVRGLRQELGLDRIPNFSDHVVGMVGWVEGDSRWDILLDLWEDLAEELRSRSGQQWMLLAEGPRRGGDASGAYRSRVSQTLELADRGVAHYYEFAPEPDLSRKMMAVCDFVVLPCVESGQAQTITQVIALNKPFVTPAPTEEAMAQALESGGGLLFSSQGMLRQQVLRLACDEQLRFRLGASINSYLREVIAWPLIAARYAEAYELAVEAYQRGRRVELRAAF